MATEAAADANRMIGRRIVEPAAQPPLAPGVTRYGLETALYNMDQPVVLSPGIPLVHGADGVEPEFYEAEETAAFRAGLKRGVVEALSMMLGFENNVNEIWQNRPLTVGRGNYGRYGQ